MKETEFIEPESYQDWMLFQLMEDLLDEPERSEILKQIAENEDWSAAWARMNATRLHADESMAMKPELKRSMLKTVPLWKAPFMMWSGVAAACMALIVVARLFLGPESFTRTKEANAPMVQVNNNPVQILHPDAHKVIDTLIQTQKLPLPIEKKWNANAAKIQKEDHEELQSFGYELAAIEVPPSKVQSEFVHNQPEYTLPAPLITRIRIIQDDENIAVVGLFNSILDKTRRQLQSFRAPKIQFKTVGTFNRPGFAIDIRTRTYETQALVMVKEEFWPFSKSGIDQPKN